LKFHDEGHERHKGIKRSEAKTHDRGMSNKGIKTANPNSIFQIFVIFVVIKSMALASFSALNFERGTP
jgi:hypothetical protein